MCSSDLGVFLGGEKSGRDATSGTGGGIWASSDTTEGTTTAGGGGFGSGFASGSPVNDALEMVLEEMAASSGSGDVTWWGDGTVTQAAVSGSGQIRRR